MLANQIGLSDKYVSENHAIASQSKFTAGEASKKLKKLGIKATAKEVIESFRILNDREPEWHHSGFYKNRGKSRMGRTFFFTEDQILELAEKWLAIAQKKFEINRKNKPLEYAGNLIKYFFHKENCFTLEFEGHEFMWSVFIYNGKNYLEELFAEYPSIIFESK